MSPSADTLLNRFLVKAKFRHMQVLVKLAELGSMRRAALAVNMTQPAISQLVQELERLLETDLFFRHARGVEPTEATKELLPIAHRVLGALEDGAETIASRLQEQDGIVRVTASPAAIGGMIHGRLDGFARRYPNIQLHIAQASDTDPLGAISDRAVDVICTRQPAVIPEGWTFETCVEDMLVAVCGTNHPLAQRATVTPEELGQAKWLMNRVGSVARRRFEDLAETYGWPPGARCQMVMHIPALTKEMLETGKYLAIMPRSVALPMLGAGTIRELASDMNTALKPLGFLWEKDRAGAASAAFVSCLRARPAEGMDRLSA